ncbi:cysteine desulfurase family protein [Cyclobacterium jeungdonense]|uniref:cysteine desulfurase n=1 Tax=Cyclobacterium jeungdonense TaxID=708087 RepID=A0ABT8CED0_9BACT|nr:cysteine desulfurase family protein [Cyclobacterium jeungdonense]MDN3689938.1 cysteine desulfurase family protein [Cyclobacterium jeungdonense]
MKYPVYLDYNATTPCHPAVLEEMLPFFSEHFGNPSSGQHPFGWVAEEAVEVARERVAGLIGAAPKEIIFTSGATEAINLALRGAVVGLKSKGNHLITIETEHKAVLDTVQVLEKQGFEVTYLPVQTDGAVSLDLLKKSIRAQTVLVAVMLANNETGYLHPLKEMAAIARDQGVLFFTDAVQAVGKVPVNVKALDIDMLALSGHKMYGPKGVGALYLRKSKPGITLESQITGGGQETGRRSGTLNVPGIVGLGKAAEIAGQEYMSDGLRLGELRDKLEKKLLAIPGARLNGTPESRLPHVSNISFSGVPGKQFLIRINKHLAVSSGSACSSISDKPSHVLRAMGLDSETAIATLRLSLGKSTSEKEVDFASDFIKKTHQKLKNGSL